MKQQIIELMEDINYDILYFEDAQENYKNSKSAISKTMIDWCEGIITANKRTLDRLSEIIKENGGK